MTLVGKAVSAATLAALALAAAIATPHVLAKLDHDARGARAVTPALRPLSSAFQTDIDRTYLIAAKANIPPHASYYIDQGTGVVSGDTAMAPSVKPVTQFWLYPRRPLLAPKPGAWLICFGCDLTRWGSRLHVAWREGPIAVGRLAS